MTNTAGEGAPRAGWYADPAGSPQLRWWDGTQWTQHLQPPATPPEPTPSPAAAPVYHEDQTPSRAAAPGFIDPAVYAQSAPVQPSLASGTSIYTPFIWLIVLLPLLSVIAIAAFDFRVGYVATGGYNTPLHNPMLMNPMFTDPMYIVITLLGWVIYGVSVWMAYLDWRALGRIGVVRPFHWAWTFLGGIVYVIGRSAVVHRRVGGGLLPIWISVGVVVVGVIVLVVKLVSLLSSLISLYSF